MSNMDCEWAMEGARGSVDALQIAENHGVRTLRIPETGALRIAADKVRFFVGRAPAAKEGLFAAKFATDGRAGAFLGASALAHALVLALLMSIPPESSQFVSDPFSNLGRLVSVRSAPVEEPKKERGQDEGLSGTATGAAISGDPGKAGTPDSNKTVGKRAVKKRAETEQLSREQTIAAARDAGINRFFRQHGDYFQNLTAPNEFSSGLEDRDVLGGMTGEIGEVGGTFGHHVAGYMTGGPGGTIHSSTTFGRCRNLANCRIGDSYGDGKDWGTGTTTGRDKKRKAGTPPEPKFGPITGAGPDKDIIRRYVKRKRARIRHCYERALLSSPNLEGVVDTKFVIATNGAVLSARASGLSSEVSSCVAGVLKSIQFPAFGMPLSIRYPFTFHSN
jgi:hypothetical protein